MSRERVNLVWAQATAAGVLPADATLPEQESRPWPVVLLTALGAWLAAVPLLGVVGMLLGDLVHRGAGPYVIGVLVLAAALVVLRSRGVPLFVEQLAVPALLVGGGALGFGLFRDLSDPGACAVLAIVGLGLAAAIPKAWLRVLLSAAATIFIAMALSIEPARSFSGGGMTRLWLAWQVTMALWLGAIAFQQHVLDDGRHAGWAATLESMLVGGLLATLVALAWWSGSTFLIGGGSGELFRELARQSPWARPAMQSASAVFAVAGGAWLAHRWPGLRRAWCAGMALVLVALAWFMPALGAVLLVLAVCAASQRWRVATVAALAAAWIVGAFYYQLAWPLANKALVLVAAAALLGALTWFAPRTPAGHKPAEPAGTPRATLAGIALSLVAVLAVANAGIWQKERLIATGRPVFVELAPVDPRSMMQGDYMQLNFRLPDTDRLEVLTSRRPQVVARLDANGVATPLRLHDGGALAPDELRIDLTPKNGRWVLVSDAWFFSEGEAERWARARYGEFRVDASGGALLVGLRGPKLEAL